MKPQVVRPWTWVHTIGFVLFVIYIGSILQSIAVGANSETININPEVITFIVGESTIVKAPWPTKRYAVTDPAIVNMELLTAEQVLLQGIKVRSRNGNYR